MAGAVEKAISAVSFLVFAFFDLLNGLFASSTDHGLKENTCAWKSPRWSDCGCGTCVSWQQWQEKGQETLHLVHREPTIATGQDNSRGPIDNVIFLHGFLSSSLLWAETVFPNISEEASRRTRMFAVDLLGFGSSAKTCRLLVHHRGSIGNDRENCD
ncbi:hypothetical protein HPP92_014354 [Vanilla planifolia]|uniref:AB hydrolase-1 domain-containing protein n=1 Tax=Vanilla planifolia TaxID=51239 RepID=A0A835R009_VANPL|nr:hypothetical protein HPP92_014354 [Vanilla planifolia]